MTTNTLPTLNPEVFAGTRDALHAYSRILGGWLGGREKRKHWWHISLRPSLNGLTTGVVRANVDFELELNLRDSALLARTATGQQWKAVLRGQAPSVISLGVQDFLLSNGVENDLAPPSDKYGSDIFPNFLPEHARKLASSLTVVAGAMEKFRAGIREETSPIQLWPHHFDLSMLWLPGELIAGQDPSDEEHADKQMNFGFTFGDEGIPEPYFYVTAYPLPEALPAVALPAGTIWQTGGFNGAVLTYAALLETPDPDAYLQELWGTLLTAGRRHLLADPQRETSQ